MGNQLAGLAPPQIHHVEQCLQDIPNLRFEEELNSTRFFKVAKVRSKEYDKSSVVKVFMIPPNASLPINKHKNALKLYWQRMDGTSNILPYTDARVTDRAAFLVRDFVDHSLFERIISRPFLTPDEKKWIAFQLLCALSQCHKDRILVEEKRRPDGEITSETRENPEKMCHGDLKSENVLLTNWGWLYVADMAPFKPIHLPADNPGEFAFFFDSSRRRACYVAPERFIDTARPKSPGVQAQASEGGPYVDPSGEVRVHDADWPSYWIPPGYTEGDLDEMGQPIAGLVPNRGTILSQELNQKLHPSMDIFSAGCVLLELFTDGTTPFNLSQLLAYRAGDKSRLALLEQVQDKNIRAMISSMIQLSEHDRVTADECLMSQRGKAFPEFYYKFLKLYMQNLLQPSMQDPDARVCKIKRDLPSIIERQAVDTSRACKENGSLVIEVNVLTAALKSVQSDVAKMEGLAALLEMARYLTSDIVLDRIVPYMLEFVHDPSSEVRRLSIECVTQCVSGVSGVQSSDLNFFPDYLLPALAILTTDPDPEVRVTFAENAAKLAETALRFLDQAQAQRILSLDGDEKPPLASYDAELQVLRAQMRDKVVTLFSETNSRVRQSLMNTRSLTALCNFFGKSKANDILLSHTVTFLNDKNDFLIRCSFFEQLPILAAMMGSQSTSVVRSLLEQGLMDPTEAVVESCVRALSRLVKLGLLSASLTAHFLEKLVPLMAHPCERIRRAALSYLATFARHSSETAVYARLVANEAVNSYFSHQVSKFDSVFVLDSSLCPPIPRTVLDCAARSHHLEALISTLQERKNSRNITRLGHQPSYACCEEKVNSLFRKMQSLGMTAQLEDRLIALKSILISLHRARYPGGTTGGSSSNQSLPLGVSSISGRPPGTHQLLISLHPPSGAEAAGVNTNLGLAPGVGAETEANKEWQHMFMSNTSGTTDFPVTRGSLPNMATGTKSFGPPVGASGASGPVSGPSAKVSIPGAHPITISCGPSPAEVSRGAMGRNVAPDGGPVTMTSCEEYVRKYEVLMQERLSTGAVRLPDMADSFQWIQLNSTPAWRPKGILVAHLHEHKPGHVTLLSHPSGHQLISCSGDGSVKLWDCGMSAGMKDATTNRYMPSRSLKTYLAVNEAGGQPRPCKGMVWTEHDTAVATVSDASCLHVIDRSQGTALCVSPLPVAQLGRCLCLAAPRGTSGGRGDSSLLVYATTGGYIVAKDLRCPGSGSHAWVLQQGREHGMISCLVVHGCHTWLVSGSSRGRLVCWDLRYQRPVSQAEHPLKASFHRLDLHPAAGLSQTEGSRQGDQVNAMGPQILAACDKNNEVSSWDLETCTRVTTLWASHVPLFSSTMASPHSVRAFLTGLSVGAGGQRHPYVITGGTDFRLRYWDLAHPENSAMIAVRGTEETAKASVTYRTQVVEGTEVLIEELKIPAAGAESQTSAVREPTRGHVNIVSDLSVVSAGQPFLVSASLDGVIKFWK